MKLKRQAHQKITPEIAEWVFKRFIAMLYRLVVVEKRKFDLIVAPGDSGAVMMKFLIMFYERIKQPIPKTLLIPVQRYTQVGVADGKYFDNSVLLPEIKKQLDDIKKLNSILFVDDEIWKAFAAKTCAELVIKSLPKQNRILYTIVAENHGFEWHYDIPTISIQYYAHSKWIPRNNGVIFSVLPNKIYKQFTEIDKKVSKRFVMQALLVGFSKMNVKGKPVYGNKLVGKYLKSIKHYDQMRAELEVYLAQLVDQGVKEYQLGEIEFKF